MIKYRYTEDIMKNRRNKIGYGILSLALALALPLNASATEGKLTPVDSSSKTSEPTSNKLLKDGDIKTDDTNQDQAKPVLKPTTTSTTTQISQPKSQTTEKNTNYLSQKDKEDEDKLKVTPHPVKFEEKLIGATNHAYIRYSFGIDGDELEKDYTISVFALKNSQVKHLKLDNVISDSNVSMTGEELEKTTEKIESDDLFGFRTKQKIKRTGSVAAVVEIEEGDDPGDYSLYYVVSKEGKSIIGKMDANVGKSGDYNFYLSRDEVKKDYLLPEEEKINPFENLPFTKYLLNDTEDEKTLADFINPGLGDKTNYKLVVTYIDPISFETKKEDVINPQEYKIPANVLARFDVREKSDTTNLISDSEISTDELEISEDRSAVALRSAVGVSDSKKASSKKEKAGENDLVEKEKATLRKLYPNLDPESLDIKGFSQAIKKQSDKLEGLIDKTNLAQTASLRSYTSNQVDSNVQKLLEESKKTVLALEPDLDEENLDIRALSQALKTQTQRIETLIQQAFLNFELDSLAELEKVNPDQAKEEYKKIYELVKEAKDVNSKASNKLIELDEINLVDNMTDPLIKRVEGAKPVLNLGMLTPLTKIENLTKDSPKESERNFSTNLQKKLEAAVNKVETVTISAKDDKKLKDQAKEDKDNKDPNKKTIVLDSKDKEKAKENKEDKTQKTEPAKESKVNTPIFIKYLQRLYSIKSKGNK